MSKQEEPDQKECPVCMKHFSSEQIEVHVNRCIFLNTRNEGSPLSGAASAKDKRSANKFKLFDRSPSDVKKAKLNPVKFTSKVADNGEPAGNSVEVVDSSDEADDIQQAASSSSTQKLKANLNFKKSNGKKDETIEKSIPLAEKMRPTSIEDYVGQSHIIGKDTILRNVLDKNEIPSMIFWGPPGCGKTTLAHIIANRCKQTENTRFVKLSATMVGVNDVKEVVKVAKNEQKFKRKTILFMDEIHRFNKLQQDIFLPHVESGAITLIGATTENPSFSLNSALLSRCRVIVLEKLEADHMFEILTRSLRSFDAITLDNNNEPPPLNDLDFIPKVIVERESIKWLAEMCDGDARIALNSLQLAMQSILENETELKNNLKLVSYDAIKDGIKKSHLLYDRKGDQHYDMISALHKSIRASDDNAALYWCTRIMLGGEDPRYICRRMVRAASEDIGLADPQAVQVALSALNAVQLVGMPEADCIIAQCAIYLARAPKNSESYLGLERCKRDINECKGPLPSVPLHLRNAPTKLMKDLGYGKGYNLLHKDKSGLNYMPEGLEHRDYFN